MRRRMRQKIVEKRMKIKWIQWEINWRTWKVNLPQPEKKSWLWSSFTRLVLVFSQQSRKFSQTLSQHFHSILTDFTVTISALIIFKRNNWSISYIVKYHWKISSVSSDFFKKIFEVFSWRLYAWRLRRIPSVSHTKTIWV